MENTNNNTVVPATTNNLREPLVITLSEQLFVGYRLNKPGNLSGKYVDAQLAEELLEALIEANNALMMASLIDKTNTCNKAQLICQNAINKATK